MDGGHRTHVKVTYHDLPDRAHRTDVVPGPAEHITHSLLLLVSGGALIFMTFMRYSLPVLGWVVFAPFLVFLHQRSNGRRHLAVLAALVVAFLAALSKMATPEIHWAPPVVPPQAVAVPA